MADRDRWTEATRLAEEVAAFARYPGATVHVLTRGSADWSRYAIRAQEQFAETDETFEALSRGLGPTAGRKEQSAVWQARRAARDTFFNSQAQHAVVAAVGDSSMFTVTGFVRAGDELEIVAAGSTHPGIGGVPAGALTRQAEVTVGDALTIRPGMGGNTSSVPSAEQLGAVGWYSVNLLAAKEGRGVVDGVSSTTWRGPAAELERPTIMGPAGESRGAARQSGWTREEVQDLATTTTGRLPQERNPFHSLEHTLDGVGTNRRYAVIVQQYLDKGQAVSVLPGEPEQLSGARSVFVHDPAGVPRLAATMSRSADGTVVIRDMRGATAENRPVLLMVGLREAARLGVGFRQTGAMAYRVDPAMARRVVRDVRGVLGDRLDELPGPGWAEAGEVRASPGDAAEAVARFRDSGGDVVRVRPGDPLFEDLRQRVADRMAEALQVPMDDEALRRLDGADAAGREVDPELAAMWQAFNPPVGVATESGTSADADYTTGTAPFPPRTSVAVALGPDGAPLAAAGYRETSERVVIGAAGGPPDALTAAIVDGVYYPAGSRPVGGYVSEQVAEAYGQAGASVGGAAAFDAEWLTSVETSKETARECIRRAYELRPGLDPVHADRMAERLRGFAGSGAEVAVLNHADLTDRRRAAHVLSVLGGADRDQRTGEPAALGSAADAQHRATVVVVDGGEPVAFATVDSRPGGPIEVVDASLPAENEDQAAAVGWWLHNHQARLGREMRDSDTLQAKTGADTDSAGYDLAKSKQLVTGVRNRLGDRMDSLATGAGEQFPGTNGAAVRLPQQPRQVDQSGPERPGPGGAQRDHKPRGHER